MTLYYCYSATMADQFQRNAKRNTMLRKAFLQTKVRIPKSSSAIGYNRSTKQFFEYTHVFSSDAHRTPLTDLLLVAIAERDGVVHVRDFNGAWLPKAVPLVTAFTNGQDGVLKFCQYMRGDLKPLPPHYPSVRANNTVAEEMGGGVKLSEATTRMLLEIAERYLAKT